MIKLKFTTIAATTAITSAAVCIFIYHQMKKKKCTFPLFEEEFFDDAVT